MKKEKKKVNLKYYYIAGGIIAFLLLLLTIIPYMTTLNSFKETLQRDLSQKFQTNIQINSDIKYRLFPFKKVYVKDIKIHDITIDELIIKPSFIELLRGKLGLKNIQIESKDFSILDIQKTIVQFKDINDLYFSTNSIKINNEVYEKFKVEIKGDGAEKSFTIIFSKSGTKYQITGLLSENSENQMQVLVYKNDDNILESNGFFHLDPFIYNANFKAKTSMLDSVTKNIIQKGDYEFAGQLRYENDSIKIINSSISGPQLIGNFQGSISKDSYSLEFILSELTLSQNFQKVLSQLPSTQNSELKILAQNFKLNGIMGELSLLKLKDERVHLNLKNDTLEINFDGKIKSGQIDGKMTYSDSQTQLTSQINTNFKVLNLEGMNLKADKFEIYGNSAINLETKQISSSLIFNQMQFDNQTNTLTKVIIPYIKNYRINLEMSGKNFKFLNTTYDTVDVAGEFYNNAFNIKNFKSVSMNQRLEAQGTVLLDNSNFKLGNITISQLASDKNSLIKNDLLDFLPMNQYQVIYIFKNGNLTSADISSDKLKVLLAKNSDSFDITYKCDDAAKCLNLSYLKDNLPLNFTGRLSLGSNYKIENIQGNLNKDTFTGEFSQEQHNINFSTFDFVNTKKSLLEFNIYDGKEMLMLAVFDSVKAINIKIKNLTINGTTVNNLDISYKDNALKVLSQNIDLYARKADDFSGYIKTTKFPVNVNILKDSPLESYLQTCDIDAIFVSKDLKNFSSFFFDLQSDFKFSCSNSIAKNFNLSDAIKNVYGISQLSFDSIEKGIREGLLTKSTETSEVSFQGQLNRGSLKIVNYKAQNSYGNVTLLSQFDLAKKQFNIKGKISLDYLSTTPLIIGYKNSGSIYKNNPEFLFQKDSAVQKYYIDSQRSKLDFL